MINKLNLIRSVGQFDSVTTGINLGRLTLVYAENARGKTTLAAVMRSLSTGQAVPINERRPVPLKRNGFLSKWMATSANTTDSARQAHMIAWAILRASH